MPIEAPEEYFVRVGTPCRPCAKCNVLIAEILSRTGKKVLVDKPKGEFVAAAVFVVKTRTVKGTVQDTIETQQDTCQPCRHHQCKGRR